MFVYDIKHLRDVESSVEPDSGPASGIYEFSLSMLMSIYLFDAPYQFHEYRKVFSVIRLNSCENVTGSE